MEYFIPGFIFITIFQLLTSRKVSTYQIILSVVISYILKAVCSIGHNFILQDTIFTWDKRVIILSLLAILLSVFLVVITELKSVNRFLSHINHKSIHNDIWQDVIDYKNGTTLRLICNDAIYTGVLLIHEEKGNESWFILEDYIVEESINEYKAEDYPYPTRLAVNLKDVKRVELFYAKEIDNNNGLINKIRKRNKSKNTQNNNNNNE